MRGSENTQVLMFAILPSGDTDYRARIA